MSSLGGCLGASWEGLSTCSGRSNAHRATPGRDRSRSRGSCTSCS
jgi:hypothetical protein